MQQLAGSIIDVDEQGAFGTAVLKPPVMRNFAESGHSNFAATTKIS